MSGLLELEPLIVERLRTQLPATWGGVALNVGSLAEIIGHNEIAPLCPVVYVMPGGSPALDADEDSPLDDAISIEDQQWQVIALLRFQRGTTSASFVAAGELMAKAYAALHGWRPEAGTEPMRYQGREAPEPVEAGVMQFALNFTVVRAFDPAEFQP